MVSQKAVYMMEIESGENKFMFVAPLNLPLGQYYDACHKMLNEISVLMNEVVKKSELPQENVEIKV